MCKATSFLFDRAFVLMFFALPYLTIIVPICVFQGVDRLFELTAGGTHVDDHDSFAVSAQGIFQKPC
jgi:hypothetical protein